MAKHVRRREPRSLSFYLLAAFFGLFVLFLYGPIATIVILSFQGPNGGLTFPTVLAASTAAADAR